MTKEDTRRAIVCPSCGKLVSANAKECIHCGRKNPGMFGLSTSVGGFFNKFNSAVPIIVAVCVALYLVSLILDPRALFQPRGIFDLLSPSMMALYRLGMTGTEALVRGRWWTLITAIYLHGSVLHILFNMLWTLQLGPTVESLYGRERFILIFTISGIIGFVASTLFGVSFTIGASGSIFGLMGALVYYGRRRGGYFGAAIYRQMIMWAGILFFMGFLMAGVNNFAHAGGFIGGYISAMVLGYSEMRRPTFVHMVMALIAIGVTILAFILTLLTF